VLHSFGGVGDGVEPLGVRQGSDGSLYGTTSGGGADTNGYGTVFKLNNDGTGYSILHSFGGGADGQYPSDALVEGADGALYGSAYGGGAYTNQYGAGLGVIIKLNKDGSGYKVLYNFGAITNDGVGPSTLLKGSDGTFYGTTGAGGAYNDGTVFRLNADGSGYAVLHTFNPNADGGQSPGGLVEGRDGALYGTTYFGGPLTNKYRFGEGLGTLFKLNKDGSGFTVLHNFTNAGGDGRYPARLLTQGRDGAFYGTTTEGGEFGPGTFFKLWPPETPDILDVRPAAGSVQVSFAGVSGYRYQVLRSTDLTNWTQLPTITMPASGTYTNLDAVPLKGQTFYRAAWVP
jgi:uncharacterized repeat protein (TIGR03803 family)